jgi:hypothetical protein
MNLTRRTMLRGIGGAVIFYNKVYIPKATY